MDNSKPSAAAPSKVNRTVPLRRANAELRSREYLTVAEIAVLAATAKHNRWGHRDATMILMAFRHGLRAQEICSLRRDQIDFPSAVVHVTRVKGGSVGVWPTCVRRWSYPQPITEVSASILQESIAM